MYELPPVYMQSLAWGGPSPPPARELAGSWPLGWLLSLALALGLLAARLRRARRAADLRLETGQELEREDLALARTARDALEPLVERQLRRWRVTVLEEFRRKGRE